MDSAQNNAAMRKALRNLLRAIADYHENAVQYAGRQMPEVLAGPLNAASDALSKPPRNCDVGTPEEQAMRFDAFCAAHLFQSEKCCSSCPCHGADGCEFKWGQLPYGGKYESNE